MSEYKFSPAQRAAIFSVHGEKCYMCGVPLTLKTMVVDHIVPEKLSALPEELAAALEAFGRPRGFEINSYVNWLPACGPCNGAKRDLVFDPSLLVQTSLQKASAKAQQVARVAAKLASDSKIAKALNVLEQAHAQGQLDPETLATLAEFVLAQREPERAGEPVRLTPLYEVVSDSGGSQTIRGPYGVGVRPSTHSADRSFACPNCGSIAAWSGARCVICGQLIED